jgi:hypothetical protein
MFCLYLEDGHLGNKSIEVYLVRASGSTTRCLCEHCPRSFDTVQRGIWQQQQQPAHFTEFGSSSNSPRTSLNSKAVNLRRADLRHCLVTYQCGTRSSRQHNLIIIIIIIMLPIKAAQPDHQSRESRKRAMLHFKISETAQSQGCRTASYICLQVATT